MMGKVFQKVVLPLVFIIMSSTLSFESLAIMNFSTDTLPLETTLLYSIIAMIGMSTTMILAVVMDLGAVPEMMQELRERRKAKRRMMHE